MSQSSKSTASDYAFAIASWFFSAPLGLVIGLIASPLALLGGWVSFKLWNIFILPTVGRPLPIAFFIGVALLYNLFAASRSGERYANKDGAEVIRDLGARVVGIPFTTLGLAYGAAWWMGLPR